MTNLIEKKPLIVLEIGSGSGVVATAIASLFKNAAYCMAVDINMNACEVTRNTAQLNYVNVKLFSHFPVSPVCVFSQIYVLSGRYNTI